MRVLLIAAITLMVGVPSATARELIWNDRFGIHQVQTGDPPGPVLFGTFETGGIAVDPAGDQLFWSDILPLGSPLPGGVIRSGSLRGGEIRDVARTLTSPAGVAVDVGEGKLFWTDLGDAAHPSAVFSANLDGSEMRMLISGTWLSEITGIAVDVRQQQLYFTYVNPLLDSLYAGGIARAAMDGSNLESIVDGLVKPAGIAIDSQGESLFWADWGLDQQMSGAILTAALDGQHRRTILGGIERPYGVALDLEEKKIYWTDLTAGKIQRANMTGDSPFIEDVLIGLDAPKALAIVPEPDLISLATALAVLLCASHRRRNRSD